MFKGFQKPKRLVANTETLTERYGMFSAQPFERGFGSTIGTGLRRVLLSSIEGAAITAVRIEGVAHEFSPIPGVRRGGSHKRRGPAGRLHPDRFGPFSRAQGELLGGGRTPGPDDRLRQAHHRSVDQRSDLSGRRRRTGVEAS